MGPERPRAEKTCPWAETSIYQFRQVGLSASWSVGDLVVGELVCRRVVQLPLTKDFLLHRSQRVKINEFSAWDSVISGTPQGSECPRTFMICDFYK